MAFDIIAYAMGVKDEPSLQAAKWIVFDMLCKKCGFNFTPKLCKNSNKLEPEFRVVLVKFNPNLCARTHSVALKYEDTSKRLHFFRPKFDYSFFWEVPFNSYGIYSLSNMPRKWTSEIFDQICALSDAGNKFVLVTYEPKTKKKDTIAFMEPYEGSKWQIEADLRAPDYASLDWRNEIELPF